MPDLSGRGQAAATTRLPAVKRKCPDGGDCVEAYCFTNNTCMTRAMADNSYSVRDDPDPGIYEPGDDPFSNADRN